MSGAVILSLLTFIPPIGPTTAQQRPRHSSDKAQPPKLTSHVILISIDGLRPEYVLKPDAYKLSIPNLWALSARGARPIAVESVYPSLSYPAHVTIATGMLPADHGVTSDQLFNEENGAETGEKYQSAQAIKTDTVWDAARRAGLTTAAIGYPVTAGAAIDFNLPEIFDGQDSAAARPAIRRQANPTGLMEEISSALKLDPSALDREPRDLAGAETQDQVKAAAAGYIVEKHRPNLTLLRLTAFGDAQRRHGPFSKEALLMLERTDALLKRIGDAIGRAGLMNETTFLIVSAHGSMPVGREFHPNAVLAKKGFLTADAQGRVLTWRAIAQAMGGAAAVFVKDPQDEIGMREAEEAFREVYEKPDSPVWRIVSRREVSQLGANPRAAFYLEAAPGYVMSSRLDGGTTSKSPARGSHGHLPQRSEMRAVLIAAGRGIKPSAKVEYARLADIAPTVARLLGLEIRASRGRVIAEVVSP